MVALAASLAGLLVFLAVGAAGRVDTLRSGLAAGYARERQQQLTQASSLFESSLRDVAADLHFAAGMVDRSTDPVVRDATLEGVVGSTTAYVLAGVLEGSHSHRVADPQYPSELSSAVDAALEETLARAARREAGAVEVSPALPDQGDDAWLRVFATPIRGGALALVVDFRQFVGPLWVTLDGDTRLLLLGPYGRPTPASSDSLFAAAMDENPALTEILAGMRAGEEGTVTLGSDEVEQLDGSPGEIVVSWRPIRIDGGRHWSAATFASLRSVREHERAITREVGTTGLLIGIVVLLFSAYAGLTWRRTVALQETLAHREALARVQERAQRILDTLPNPVVAVDAAGRVAMVNGALRRLAPGADAGIALEAAFPGADEPARELLRGLLARAFASGEPESTVQTRLRLFDRPASYALSAVPLTGDADARGVLVIDDLTEITALQEQLVRAEKLATVGVLAAGIAHEIGTPLSVIRGRADHAAGRLGADHPQSDGLRVIVEQSDRVVRTIRALLDFARRQPVQVGPVSVLAAARSAVELLRFEAERRDVLVDLGGIDADATVAADRDALQQVLVNLLVNALDASPPGAGITIRATGGARVRIEIADRGHGIAPEDLHRVLDPFYTTKKRGQGTGLGLPIVDRIVRDHGGFLTIESAVGKGTCVILDWPGVLGSDRA